MGAVCPSETSVNLYKIAWRHVQETAMFRKYGKALKYLGTPIATIIWKFQLKNEILYMPPFGSETHIPV
jgi:hypothetical protein